MYEVPPKAPEKTPGEDITKVVFAEFRWVMVE